MTGILALAMAFAAQGPAEPPAPQVQEVEIRGAAVFDREAVLGMIRLRPGDPLRREPDAIAQGLRNRYRIAGYPAASVSSSFDEASGRLLLDVDEGRLREVVIEGLEGAASRRAIEAMGLETGEVLREGDIWSALARVEEASEGAVRTTGDPSYRVEPGEEGARLVLRLRRDPALVRLRPWGPRASGRYNRVDGLSLGAATEVALTDASSYSHLRLLARASYGFSSRKVRYTLGLERPFGWSQRYVLGYEFHDLTDSEDGFRSYGLEEEPGAAYNSKRFTDFFRRLGHEAYAFARIGGRAQAGVAWRSDNYASLPVETGSDQPNPPVEEGRMRSLVGTVRFVSRGDLFHTRRWERESFLFPSLYVSPAPKPERWRAEATYEVATPGLGSEFDFTRFIGRVRLHRPLLARHVVDTVAFVGFSSGRPPLPKRFFLGGLGTLRGFDKKEFTGKNFVLGVVEWSWFPPPRFVPALIPFYDGGATWGGDRPGTGWKHDVGLALRLPQQ
ncbi:MAG TPA: POTRA domain-containing protein, partial [Vicinamibacteria bacterium]|nr:POTRA domain-containing protein [Vicinamibacteria bacterium]